MQGAGWLVGKNDNYETYSNRKDANEKDNDNHNDKVYFTSNYYDCRGTSPGIMVTRARGRLVKMIIIIVTTIGKFIMKTILKIIMIK